MRSSISYVARDDKPRLRSIRRQVIQAAQGHCAACRAQTRVLVPDHVIPIAIGGDDTVENGQALCEACHRSKTAKDAGIIAKCRRIRNRRLGIPRGRWKRKVDGTVVRV